ncbi:uncharacterized protein MAM_02780 [Metarhizium album ARSEF 1941]|uniref:Uncharacterized protein n=1 Tax=Metarhizium album (strain ARSEF 1941) TaxID=1081103 RepID=A0A0B2X071_METAS|nr:uncharacterized protein MAM_02780 [Metarhizium album ARSEF 1941]KHN99082.1 hypothetical protein MAM_02780 [Metarhizium album ARSEF 1941]
MARFPFSFTGRKKPNIPPPPAGWRMSKAHKILGATPLNIDAPDRWDDVSSLMTSDDTSSTTGASSELELRGGHEYEHQFSIAKSDEDWGEESDAAIPIPQPSKLNDMGFGQPTEIVEADTAGALRKSQSSSTIRSWYDKSKLPLSISPQTSSSAMAMGLPPKFQGGLDTLNPEEDRGSRKKLSKLASSRVYRKRSDSGDKVTATESALNRKFRPRSIISSLSVKSTRARESRHFQNKRTKGDPHSPVPEARRPVTSGSSRLRRRDSRELPSLYSHYEEMSLRHVMRQSSAPTLAMTENGILTLQNIAEMPCDGGRAVEKPAHQRQKPVSPIPKLPTRPKAAASQSSPDVSVSSRHAKTSKTSKSPDKFLDDADLLQTSVLILSSDSEEDDVEEEPILTRPSALPLARNPSKAEASPPRLEDCRTRIVCDPRAGEKRHGRSTEQGKGSNIPTSKTCLASQGSGTRIGSPVETRSGSATPVESLFHALSSPGISIMSYASVNSEMTWQGKPGYGIQEARLMTVLQPRQPVSVEVEEKQDEASLTTVGASRQPTLNQALSTDRPTPPLSPTSVDFYIRSAPSSVHGPGSHSRLMAVTHQEEVLLSALRHKQQAVRRESALNVSEENEPESVASMEGQPKNCSHEQQGMEADVSSDHAVLPAEEGQQKGHRPNESQTTIVGSTFEFGFPAPPSFRANASIQIEQGVGRPESSRALPIQSQDMVVPCGDSIPTRPAGPAPMLALPKLPRQVRKSKSSGRDYASSKSQQGATVYFDDSAASPDLSDIQGWGSGAFPARNAASTDAPLATSWPEHERGQERGEKVPPSSKLEPRSFLITDGSSRPSVRNPVSTHGKEKSASRDEEIPRPDSPISPGEFPAVPTTRITAGNMTRLSAVESGLLRKAGEPA